MTIFTIGVIFVACSCCGIKLVVEIHSERNCYTLYICEWHPETISCKYYVRLDAGLYDAQKGLDSFLSWHQGACSHTTAIEYSSPLRVFAKI